MFTLRTAIPRRALASSFGAGRRRAPVAALPPGFESQVRFSSSDTEDYYKVLGVERGASQPDIKKAYRKRAMQTHPDQGGNHDEFSKVSQAYAVLSDEGKRQTYDQYGSEAAENMGSGGMGGRTPEDIFSDIFGGMGGGGFGGFGGGGRQRPQVKSVDVRMKLSLEEMYTGAAKTVRITRPSVCATCRGHGTKSGKAKKECGKCNGKGASVQMRNVGGGMIQQVVSNCGACDGTGKVAAADDKCPKCRGEGSKSSSEEVSIPVPAGCPNNVVLRMAGEGGTIPDATPGDLNIHIEQSTHKHFQRRGNDLIATMKISFSEALLGFERPLKLLDGRTACVQSPPHEVLQASSVLRIPGEGMPATSGTRGDLFVTVNVTMPKHLTDVQKKALTEAFGEPPKDAHKGSGNTLKTRLLKETKEDFMQSKEHAWAQQEGGGGGGGGGGGRRGGGGGGGPQEAQCAQQ